jgi:hypothetical protein
MSKFKVKLKLQGLELEVEGAKEDIPAISQNVAAQLTGLITPAAGMAGGNEGTDREPINVTPTLPEPARTKRRPSPRRSSTAAGNGADRSDVFDWKHDAAAFGNPVQGWNTADKSMWLLYAAAKQGVVQEMSGPQIAATFNKHFRQAGPILPHNVTRDLGKIKGTPPAKVSEDTTKSPPAWFLTDEGIKHAEGLVKVARGEAAGS